MTQAFPLQWPDGVPRAERKVGSQFKTSLSAALKNVAKALEMFGRDTEKPVSHIVLSSNVGGLMIDGPDDTGVAAYFTWDGVQRCIAVDRYPKPEDNLQAIYHVIEARRTEMRHGGLHIVRQTFRGFMALPAPDAIDWRKVFGFRPDEPARMDEVSARYREKARAAGTNEALLYQLNMARDAAKAALNG